MDALLGNREGERRRVEAKKILECIPIGSHHPISRSELSRILKMSGLVGSEMCIRDRSRILKMSDRDTREMIHQARKIMPIINLQDGNGYYIPDMNVMKDRRKLVLWTNQELSRSKEIIICTKPAIQTLNHCGICLLYTSPSPRD